VGTYWVKTHIIRQPARFGADGTAAGGGMAGDCASCAFGQGDPREKKKNLGGATPAGNEADERSNGVEIMAEARRRTDDKKKLWGPNWDTPGDIGKKIEEIASFFKIKKGNLW